MGWPLGCIEIVSQLPQHRGVAIDCPHRGPFRISQRGEAMIGPENIRRTIDEIEMLLLRRHDGLLAPPGPLCKPWQWFHAPDSAISVWLHGSLHKSP